MSVNAEMIYTSQQYPHDYPQALSRSQGAIPSQIRRAQSVASPLECVHLSFGTYDAALVLFYGQAFPFRSFIQGK